MAVLAEAAPRGGVPGILGRLAAELAPRPGRLAATLRIAGACALVTALWMAFRIPLPAYAAYLVFLVSGAERSATLTTALGGIVAATLALALTLLLYSLDAAEPALRLPLMTATVFLGMFLSRIIAAGPVAFLLGFVLVITQSLADGIPDPEALTRLMLWLWLVVVVPALVALLADLAWGRDPARLAREQALQTLAAVASGLDGDGAAPIPSATVLAELRRRAALLVPALRPGQAGDRRLIADLAGLARLSPLLTADVPAEIRRALAAACRACGDGFAAGRPVPSLSLPTPDELARLPAPAAAIAAAAGEILRRLAAGLDRRHAGNADTTDVLSAPRPRRAGLFVADAWTNPDHARFALKTTLAAMGCYLIYNLLDWHGIRTCMVTCFFVALGSLGETVHKLVLRLAGALLGGAIGALSIVFLIPLMTDIGHLLLLTVLVAALGAWVASGSERIAYAGMQLTFAAFVGIFQDYGPATDLAVLRDRIVGILLGNLAIALVFTTLWPVTVADRLNAVLTGARTVLAQLLRHGDQGDQRDEGGERWLALEKHLDQARRLAAMESFESGRAPAAAVRDRLRVTESLAAAVRVLLAANGPAAATAAARNAAADWLDAEPARPLPSIVPTAGEAAPAQIQALALVTEGLAALAARPAGTGHAV